jgi:hypothetical protein
MGVKAKDIPWKIIGVVLLLSALGITSYIVYQNYLAPVDGTGTEGETSTYTTFTVTSFVDGEDVSWVPLDIWVPDLDKDFDSSNDEHLRPDALADYWEREENSQEAEDISIDLSEHEYFYVIVDPSDETVFSKDYILRLGGQNQKIGLSAYHLPSNAFISNNKIDDGTAGVPTSDGNYTATLLRFPQHDSLDWSNKHVGSDWETSTSEYNDFSATRKLEFNDENNYCIEAGLYDPTVDTDKDYDDGGELYTEVFAYKLKANATISQTDGSGTQINCSVETSNVDVLVSGQYIYFAATMKVVSTGFKIDYEITFGTNITISNMYSGRLTYPNDDESGISFSAYSFSL